MSLQSLLNPQLIIPIKGKQVRIQEENNPVNTNLKEVIITNIPDSSFTFSADKKTKACSEKSCKLLPVRNNLLNNSEKNQINKCCDGIIIHNDNNGLHIIFGELKSSAGGYENQLMNSKLFVDYLIQLYNTFHLKDNSSPLQISSYQFIVFIYKRPTSQNKGIRPQRNRAPYEITTVNMGGKFQSELVKKCSCIKSTHNHIPWDELFAST